MPTNYKVLGQTSATAAATTDLLNLVRDPSFETSTLGSAYIPGPTSTLFISLGTYGMPLWLWGNSGTSNAFQITDISATANSGAVATHGSKATGFDCNNTNVATCIMYYGAPTSGVGIGFGNSPIDVASAIPVTAGTTYYYGTSMWVFSATTKITSPRMRIYWFNSAASLLSSTNLTLTNNSANNWVRSTSSAVAPANAAYATIELSFLSVSAQFPRVYWDAIHFSPVASTNTTYPTAGGSNLTLTTPFSTRLSNTWVGTANASNTVTTYAGAAVDLYTVPAATQTVASTITVSNLGTSASTYRVAVVPSGETLAKKHWIVFDAPIAANSTETYTIGVALATGNVIKVASDSADVSFSAFGSEIA